MVVEAAKHKDRQGDRQATRTGCRTAGGGDAEGEMHIIDKRSLEVVKVMAPDPGKTVAQTEFTRDGSKALVSIREMDGR